MNPLYKQIADLIKLQIRDGDYQHGARIEPENRLCEKYGVSRITVRSAVNLLCKEGLLQKRQGVGTFVTLSEEVEKNVPAVQGSFSAYCLERRRKPHTMILKQTVMKADESVAAILDVRVGEKIIYLRRLRFIDDIPVIYEEDYLPMKYKLLLNAELTDHSLFDFLKHVYHAPPKHFEDEFYVEKSGDEVAKRLCIKPGSPVLCVDQTVYDEDNDILLFNRQKINSEKYRYHVFSYGNDIPIKKERD